MPLTIYSTPQCAYCKMAKEFCKERHIEYREVDVAEDQEQASLMIKKSGQIGVPVIVIPSDISTSQQEEVIVGFNREKLTSILGL